MPFPLLLLLLLQTNFRFLSMVALKLFSDTLEGDVRAFFAFFDINHAGKIGIEDLRHSIRTVRQGCEVNGMKGEALRLCNEYKGEESMWINLCDVIAGPAPVSEEELEQMMTEADLDGDGRLNFAEFEAALMKNTAAAVDDTDLEALQSPRALAT